MLIRFDGTPDEFFAFVSRIVPPRPALVAATRALAAALSSVSLLSTRQPSIAEEDRTMTSKIVADQAAADQEAIAAMAAATDYITGVPARIQAAVDEALAGGASAEALAPLQALVESESATAQALTAALANAPK